MTSFKRVFSFLALPCLAFLATSCNNEDPVPGPTIHLSATEYEIDVTDTVTIKPKITYDYNSSYQWFLEDEIISTERELTIKPQEPAVYNLRFVVKTPSGADTSNITVQALHIVTFEEYKLEKDTANYGQGGTTLFTSKGTHFPVTYTGTANGIAWDGFAVSTGTIKTESNSKIRYSAYVATTTSTSNHFMVYHQPTSAQPVQIQFEEGVNRSLKSVEVANTAYLYYVIKSGKDVGTKFGEGRADWFTLTAIGYDANNNKTGETSVFLADYRDPIKTKRYMVEKWTKISLESLGAVNKIEFVLTSSDSNESGMVTPGYFCFDNLKIVD